MHPIYHTDALILGSYPRGEANRLYLLLTKDMGFFYAIAQGVRLEKSKLRYALQDFSLVRIDLVRGRDIWRITSATPQQMFSNVYTNERGAHFLIQLQKLIKRMIQGEESHPQIFDDIIQALLFLNVQRDTTWYPSVELALAYRILHTLGYISPKEELSAYTVGDFIPELINRDAFPKKACVEAIRTALGESHL